MRIIVLFFSFAVQLFIFGQKTIVAQSEKQVELTKNLNQLRAAKSDSLKDVLNLVFKNNLQQFLENESYGPKDFDSLRSIGKVWSDDALVGVISWNVEMEDFSQQFYAFVLKKNARNRIEVTELVDNTLGKGNTKPTDILDAPNWYGALYYDIIDVKKGNKTFYTLLGWDGAYSNSNIKIIDVLTFSGSAPKLGAPIFKVADKIVKRVFFEHSERAYMSLKYDTERSLIIYDHLSPESPNLVGFYDYYIPDLSYDGMKWEKDKWVVKEDILALNGQSQDVTLARDTKDGIETKKVESKWEDPNDGGRGDFAHKAAKPEDEPKEDQKKKKKKRKNASEKDPNATYSDKDFQKGSKGVKKGKR
jgi:hypothetical protein